MATPTATPTMPLADDQDPGLAAPRHGSGSVGPFFAVMSVIIILSVLSCIFGRYCGSRAEGPDAWYDCVGWARRCGGRCVRQDFDVEREARAAVNSELDKEVKQGKNLSLPAPQP